MTEGDDAVQENNDDVLQQNNMQVAAQDLEDDTNKVEDVHANNEYVEPIVSHPDEFGDDDWENSTRVEHITSEFNRSTTPTIIRI